MKTIVILLTIFVASIFNSSENTVEYDQECSAELSVLKDRSFKSADEDGANFIITLKNSSSKTAMYTLSTSHLSEPCDNKGGRASTEGNVNLNVSILTNTLRAIPSNEITLKSGQSYSFIVKVTVPEGTRSNSWSCINVQAESKNCSLKSIKTLSVFVPEPSEG
jgi:hypothetical protein